MSGTSQLRTVLEAVAGKALEPGVAGLKGVLMLFIVYALAGIKEGHALLLCFLQLSWPHRGFGEGWTLLNIFCYGFGYCLILRENGFLMPLTFHLGVNPV